MSDVRKRFVLVPFPAFGHIIPTLEFAKKIAQYHDVTVVVSAAKLPEIHNRSLVSNETDRHITFVPLEDGLIPDNDKDVSASQLAFLANKTNDALRKVYETLVADFVIADFPIAGSLDTCQARNIPTGVFHTASAAALCNKLGVHKDTPILPDDDWLHPKNGIADIGAQGIPGSMKQINLQIQKAIQHSRCVVLNSVREWEPEPVDFLSRHYATTDKDILFVGPLFPKENDVKDDVTQWLDKQGHRSVVYVSFGSLSIDFPPKQLSEMWMTLISLNRPFLWVLKEKEEQALQQLSVPEAEADFLIIRWAPQKLVLTHPATAVFVSHCGWNSTMESIWGGVPVVAWPMAADQHQNSQFLVDFGMALKIPDTSALFERTVSTKQIGERILELTGWKSGHYGGEFARCSGILKEKAQAAVAAGGSSYKDMVKLVQDLC